MRIMVKGALTPAEENAAIERAHQAAQHDRKTSRYMHWDIGGGVTVTTDNRRDKIVAYVKR